MIMIGNGPIPLAHPGPPGPGASASGNAVRTAAAGQGAAPEATIPAAQPERSGTSQRPSTTQPYTAAIRPVLGPSRIDATVTDPEDRYRAQGETGRNGALADFLNDRDPVPPLRRYANVPTATSIAIAALRAERAEGQAETPMDAGESPGAGDRADATQDPGARPDEASASDREPVARPANSIASPSPDASTPDADPQSQGAP